MDSPDCLLMLLSISVFYFVVFLSAFHFLVVAWFHAVDYADLCRLLSASCNSIPHRIVSLLLIKHGINNLTSGVKDIMPSTPIACVSSTDIQLVSEHGRRYLRSFSHRTLAVPRTRRPATLSDRSFAVTGPRVWNSLPAVYSTTDY